MLTNPNVNPAQAASAYFFPSAARASSSSTPKRTPRSLTTTSETFDRSAARNKISARQNHIGTSWIESRKLASLSDSATA